MTGGAVLLEPGAASRDGGYWSALCEHGHLINLGAADLKVLILIRSSTKGPQRISRAAALCALSPEDVSIAFANLKRVGLLAGDVDSNGVFAFRLLDP